MPHVLEPPLDIPPAWERSAEQIVRHRWRIILVLGAADRGKSTYCRFLTERCLAAGWRVALLDTDVGQKTIGPPASLTLGYPQPDHALASTPPAAWYFIGATNPVGHFLPIVVGVRHLREVARAACIIVNTTGLVHGAGRVLKSYKIEAVQPDVIVAIEHGHELQALLHAYRHYHILSLPPSAHARIKTSAQRRTARAHAFGTYFATASTVELALRRVVFQRGLLFTGRRTVQQHSLYAESMPEGVLTVGASELATAARGRGLPVGFERNLLCGVANRRNEGLGLAIIQHIDFAREILTLSTPVPAAHIKILQWGALYVQPDGYEVGTPVPRNLFA